MKQLLQVFGIVIEEGRSTPEIAQININKENVNFSKNYQRKLTFWRFIYLHRANSHFQR